MNFINKIFHGNFDEMVHNQFIRFGKGMYNDRAVLKITNGKSIKMTSGFEYANDFIEFIIAHCHDHTYKVKGTVYSKEKIESDFFSEIVKKKGFFIGEVNQEMSKEELSEFYELFKLQYILVGIESESVVLKTNKAPHNPRGKYKENFCSFAVDSYMRDKALEDFAFDLDDDFKKALLKHHFRIDGVDIPKEYEDDPLKIRIYARRKGFIKRIIDQDGKLLDKETELLA